MRASSQRPKVKLSGVVPPPPPPYTGDAQKQNLCNNKNHQ